MRILLFICAYLCEIDMPQSSEEQTLRRETIHVARLLARLMGGDLTYDHDGDDSIFRLTLPVVAAAAAGSPAD